MSSTPDRIEKEILLDLPIARVWHAIGDSQAFGSWFGVSLEEAFIAGRRLKAKIVPTTVDAEVARQQQPYEGKTFDLFIERVEPLKRLAFRWHPYAVEPGIDYSDEPTTLVTFELKEVPGGTQLTLTESGFDQLPLERREKAYEMNAGGWAMQMRLIGKYLARHV